MTNDNSDNEYTDRDGKTLVWITIALVIYSLALQVLAGIYELNDLTVDIGDLPYRRYFDPANINWLGYPIFYLLVAMLVHLSWAPFKRAWVELVNEGVIKQKDDRAPVLEKKDMSKIVESGVARVRRSCIAVAIIFAGVLLILEQRTSTSSVWAKDISGLEQLERACKNPDYWDKEFFELYPQLQFGDNSEPAECPVAYGDMSYTASDLCICDIARSSSCVANDQIHCDVTVERPAYTWLLLALGAQMLFIGALGMLVLAQLAAHIWLFARFEKMKFAHDSGLKIDLDWDSPLAEFGLHKWNQALNNVYWGFSLGLLVPIASRFSQRGDTLDSGQVILSFAVSLVVLGPIAATIIVRQIRLPGTWISITDQLSDSSPDEKEAALKSYHGQRLWPFDKNIASKLGIVVALTLLSYIALVNLATLT